MNFKFLTGDCDWQKYGGKFISKRLNSGDWDYWLVYEVINMEEACGEKGYNVSLFAVSPEAAGIHNFVKACQSLGFSGEVPEHFYTDVGKVEVLCNCDIKAQLWTGNGNNLSKLIKEVHYKAEGISGIFFGMMMDSPQNSIGSTGWDLIAGNVMAGLHRYREAKEKGEEITHSPALEIVSKMHDACRR